MMTLTLLFCQCSENVNIAFKQIDSLIADRQFSKLAKDFNSCNSISNINDTALFVTNLAGYFMGVVQYNGQTPFVNISLVCSQMTNSSSSPYDNLMTFFKKVIFGRCTLLARSRFLNVKYKFRLNNDVI